MDFNKTLEEINRKAELLEAAGQKTESEAEKVKLSGKKDKIEFLGIKEAVELLVNEDETGIDAISDENLTEFMESEEFEALDELSKATLNSYRKKAVNSRRDIGDKLKSIKKGDPSQTDLENKHFNRNYGIAQAKRKVAEETETENIDELSKPTLASYIKKAAQKNSIDAMRVGADNTSPMKDVMKKSFALGKRNVNIGKAANRLTKESATESTTESEQMNIEQLLADYSLDEIAEYMVSEEYETLDELSKATLGSYVKKAHLDVVNTRSPKLDRLRSTRSQYGPAALTDKESVFLRKGNVKAIGRRNGINGAVERLTKESTEQEIAEAFAEFDASDFIEYMVSEEYKSLDELSKATLGSYVKKSAAARADIVGQKKDIDHRDGQLSRASFGIGNDVGHHVDAARKELNKKKSKLDDKDFQRGFGIHKAIKRLTKESTDTPKGSPMELNITQAFEGETLSEEFKTKVTTMFEAAVAAAVSTQVEEITESVTAEAQAILDESLEELTQKALDESTELKEGLEEKIDGYLDYVVEQWLEENKLALERGIKVEMFESFVGGMKGLFESHYINVPETELDVLEELKTEVQALSKDLDESTAQNVTLRKVIQEVEKKTQIEEAADGLTELNADRFRSLAEDLVFEDGDKFAQKLEVIRENFFDKAVAKVKESSGALDDVQQIVIDESVKPVSTNSVVDQYAKALSKNPSIVK